MNVIHVVIFVLKTVSACVSVLVARISVLAKRPVMQLNTGQTLKMNFLK